MIRFSQIVSIAALVLFTYAQWQGWTFERAAHRGSSGSSVRSYHK